MMKHIYKTAFLTITLMCTTLMTYAQVAVCKKYLSLETKISACHAEITPFMIDDGSFGYDMLQVDKVTIESGLHLVTLTAKKFSGSSTSCVTTVNVKDKTPPVVIVKENVTLDLGPSGSVNLAPVMFDDGSFDNCSNIFIHLNPSILTCASPNPSIVEVTVYDAAGNSNKANVEVNLEQKFTAVTSMVCNALTNINVPVNGTKEVLASDILEGGPYYCASYYTVQLSENNIPYPSNTVSSNDVNKTITAKIIDPATGNACWGNLTVSLLDCSQQHTICDTKSSCSPIEDCASGHTLTDNIEWPCDIIENASIGITVTPSPEFLAVRFGLSDGEVKPQFVEGDCSKFYSAYSDQRIEIYDGPIIVALKIVRTWTVVNWMTTESANFNQIIKFNMGSIPNCSICDTKGWNTPIGDCLFGHTDQDAIEWPSEYITVSSGTSLQDLINNPQVHPYDVMPRIVSGCQSYGVTFNDVVSPLGDSILISRKWEVINWETNSYNSYIQLIKAPSSNTTNRTICVKDMNGQYLDQVHLQRLPNSIPNQIIDGPVTTNNECTTLEFNENYRWLWPYRKDADKNGIDIVDLVMLQQGILKQIELTNIQKNVADLNRDGKATASDLFELKKIINAEILSDSISWFFYNITNATLNLNEASNPWNLQNSITSIANITNQNQTYHFIGQKPGDIDNSYSKENTLATFIAKDIVMNKGESYTIDLAVDRQQSIEGLQLDIMQSPEMEVVDIQSSKLPIFGPSHFKSLSDRKRILWYDSETFQSASLDKGNTVLTLTVKAKANTTLFACLKFGNRPQNKIKSTLSLPNYDIALAWTDLISDTDEAIADGRDAILYPNPTSSDVIIKWQEKIDLFYITDLAGKQVAVYKNGENKCSVADLHNGVYLVHIMSTSGKTCVKKLFVTK